MGGGGGEPTQSQRRVPIPTPCPPPPIPTHPAGFVLPVFATRKIRQRVQDAPFGAAAGEGDGSGERAEDSDGGTSPGEHRMASQHPYAVGTQHRGQFHRGHPSAQEEGEEVPHA